MRPETALVEQVNLIELAGEADLVDPGLQGGAQLLGLEGMSRSITFLKFQASSKLHQCQFPQGQFCNHGQYISTSQ